MTVVDQPARTAEGVLARRAGPRADHRRPRRRDRGGPPGARRPARRPRSPPAASGCCCPPATAAPAPTSRAPCASSRRSPRADASVAWTVMIGAGAWLDLAGLPRASFDDARRHGARRHRRRRVQPDRHRHPRRRRLPGDGPVGLRQRLRARHLDLRQLHRAGDGRRTGRQHAHRRVLARARSSSRTPGTCRACAARAATTSASTTCSSRPSAPSCRWAIEPCLDEPIVRVPVARALLALPIASVALGIARGALDDIVALATGKVPLLAVGLARRQPAVPVRAGRGGHRAARRPRRRSTSRPRRSGTAAASGAELDDRTQRARARAAAAWATDAVRRHRRHGLPQRWGQHALQRPPAPAPAPRRPRHHPALPRQGRHPDRRRRRPRRPRTRRPAVLSARSWASFSLAGGST